MRTKFKLVFQSIPRLMSLLRRACGKTPSARTSNDEPIEDLIDWRRHDEDQMLIELWKAVRKRYGDVAALQAIKGGMLCGDIEAAWNMYGLQRHDYAETEIIEWKLVKEVGGAAEYIEFRNSIPLRRLEQLVIKHRFTDDQRFAHRHLYSDREMDSVQIQIYFALRNSTG